MIPRLINISKSQSFFLFGARGTGKSTFLEQGWSGKDRALFIDLLLPNHFDSLLRDPQSLLSRIEARNDRQDWIVIDEVQKIPPLLDVVHYAIEKMKVKFALTGSSARKLKRGQANLLAGRAFVYHLFPITSVELKEDFDLLSALHFGTLPKVLELESTEDKRLFLDGYTQTYLKEEILSEQIIRSLPPFRKFLEVAAQMNGQLINFSAIAREVSVDDKTVKSYFNILEDTLVGYLLPSYHYSVRKSQLQAPKFYFFDCGVKRAMQGSLMTDFNQSSYGFGQAFEHFLITEIFRLNHYYRKDFKLFHLRTQDGTEIDLILERPGAKVALIEIKSTKSVRKEHLKHLQSLHKYIPDSERFCLSLDPIAKKIDGIYCSPWYQGLVDIGIL